MRRKTVAVPLAVPGIVAAGHAVAQEPAAEQRKPIDEGDTVSADPALDITAHTDDDIAGVLSRAALISHFAWMQTSFVGLSNGCTLLASRRKEIALLLYGRAAPCALCAFLLIPENPWTLRR